MRERVLRKGQPIDLDQFTWDEKTRTFASYLDYLVIDFSDINSVTITAGDYATIQAGDNATIKAGYGSKIMLAKTALWLGTACITGSRTSLQMGYYR